MVTFHALTNWKIPSIHIWRQNLALQYNLAELGRDEHDFSVFRDEPDHQIHEYANFKLFSGNEWEDDEHHRLLPRFDEYRFPANVWLVKGTNRVLTQNPFDASYDEVRVHLVTARKFRNCAT